MKKRIMVIILAATLGAAVIAGCGVIIQLRIRGKALKSRRIMVNLAKQARK